jgi:hypothetical protein
VNLTPVALFYDHPRVLERAEVLYNGLPGDWESNGNPRRGRWAHRQALEQVPARWIRESDEHRIIHVQLNSCT